MPEQIKEKLSVLFEPFLEAFDSIKQHKTRNVLTGFGIAWGILILIVLLGAGEGLQKGAMRLFGNYAQNSYWFYGNITSEAVHGQTRGKRIYFDQKLLDDFNKVFTEISLISPELTSGQLMMNSGNTSGLGNVYGIYPDYFQLKLLKVDNGRILNAFDVVRHRKVGVVGAKLAEELFGTENCIGKYIQVNSTFIKIVGVLETGSMFTERYNTALIVGLPLYGQSFGSSQNFSSFGITLKPAVNQKKVKDEMHAYLARRLGFSVSDKRALFISDLEEQSGAFERLFGFIKMFLWLLGASLLTSGVVGISNIMLIVVKERTREIGIRKAMGAGPNSILFLVLIESVVITTLAGLFGMVLGMGVIKIINIFIQKGAEEQEGLVNSININYSIALLALITIIIAGCIAGIFPARKAADVKPVVAINHDAN